MVCGAAPLPIEQLSSAGLGAHADPRHAHLAGSQRVAEQSAGLQRQGLLDEFLWMGYNTVTHHTLSEGLEKEAPSWWGLPS